MQHVRENFYYEQYILDRFFNKWRQQTSSGNTVNIKGLSVNNNM